jgi:hypothetical protein
MDIFNYGITIKAFMSGLFHGLRRTGRTTRLLETMKDGDVLIVSNRFGLNYDNLLKHQAKKLGKNINVIGIEATERGLYDIFDLPSRRGKRFPANTNFFYDHVFLEDYYGSVILRADELLDKTQDSLSEIWCENKTQSKAESILLPYE